MMKNHIYISLLVFFVFLTSCISEIAIKDTDAKNELVVNAFITPDSLLSIELSATKLVVGTNTSYSAITDAVVTVSEDDIEIGNLTFNSVVSNENSSTTTYRKAIYSSSDIYPQKGKTYRIEVEHSDYDNVSCETTVPIPVPIISIDTIKYEDGYSYSVSLAFKDSADYDNYYRVYVRAKWGIGNMYKDSSEIDSIYVCTESIGTWLNSDDVLIEGAENSDDFLFGSAGNQYNIFSDELIAGKQYTLDFELSGQMFGRAYDYDKYEYTYDLDENEFYYIEIELQSISYDEYWYLQSYLNYYWNDGEFYAEPVQVYSNVENGTGIFAGYSASRYVLSSGEYPKDGVVYIYD